MADLGEGTLSPLLFLDQTEAQRAKKILGGVPGLPYLRFWMTPPISRFGFATAVGLHTKSGLGN